MPKKIPVAIITVLSLCPLLATAADPPLIVTGKTASALERLAATEVRRYWYLRSGNLPAASSVLPGRGPAVLFASGRGPLPESLPADLAAGTSSLGPEEYILRTRQEGGRQVLLIAGGSGIAVLYGAYRLAEHLGVRFDLAGDIVPDRRDPELRLPPLDEKRSPLFRLRGIQPFHDFPEGPDWWNLDEYKAVIAQLPKLGMNFFGLHTYPEGGPNAEPTVWIGLPADSLPGGGVRFAYPTSWQNTRRGNWGYLPRKTGDFHFGMAQLFESDDFGAEVMRGSMPQPGTPQGSASLFTRTAAMLGEAFALARFLGVKTCVGTETPLTIPAAVRERLRSGGLDPKKPETVRELYRGVFQRLSRTLALDYYWLWTFEGWTWDDASPEQTAAVVSDIEQALAAAQAARTPFNLATCGWVLGPPSQRDLFGRLLPPQVAVSCINREVGKAPLDPAFGAIGGRSKWAIPWLEDDPALTMPQLWAGRMRRDAADARAYGCDGLLGIHWRTRILSPNVQALAQAAWEQGGWESPAAGFQKEGGALNGTWKAVSSPAIWRTDDPAPYRDVRDRVSAYRLAVPNGTYTVTLKFVEDEITRRNGRLFDILIQGQKVAEKLDIFDRVGRFVALDLSFPGIAVRDGWLRIDFIDRIHYPAVAAIAVAGGGFARKINCGGPAVDGWEADWPETPRHLPVGDFYRDWAASQFGPEEADRIAAVFAGLDGRHPQPASWVDGPGGLTPDNRPWEVVRHEYEFALQFAALGDRISGAGNRERFHYWSNLFLYMRDTAELRCRWGEFKRYLDAIELLPDPKSRAEAARSLLSGKLAGWPGLLRSIFSRLRTTVSNPGEMGTVANWEQHILPEVWEKSGRELERLTGGPLPREYELDREPIAGARLVVPTVRTSLEPGEDLRLKAIVLHCKAVQGVTLHWRRMGRGAFSRIPLRREARGVWRVRLKAEGDLEYYVAATADGMDLVFPATAPGLCQTVVRLPRR